MRRTGPAESTAAAEELADIFKVSEEVERRIRTIPENQEAVVVVEEDGEEEAREGFIALSAGESRSQSWHGDGAESECRARDLRFLDGRLPATG